MKLLTWLVEPLAPEVAASLRRIQALDDVQYVAVMPDVHLASDVCIGVALATTELIYPAAVGADIGCGMTAVRLDANAELLESEQAAAAVLAGLYRHVPWNRHSQATQPDLPAELANASLSDPRLEQLRRRDGRVQFGTLGRGNHFLELQADQAGQLWALVHSGSRAMGQVITAFHLRNPDAQSGGLACLLASESAGQAYLHDVAWALRYAEQSRLAMLQAVERLFTERFAVSVDWSTLIQSHHNHVRYEEHFGQRWLVHRKGAQSAQADEPGILPGSMGAVSFHIAGRGCAAALCSSAHGAGRKLSRTEAVKRISSRHLQQQLGRIWFDHRRAEQLREEAPAAYKDIRAVQRAQAELTKVVRELRPVLSYKGV